eukprot:2055601-Lingulodinium_polyedra.AAC.1
MGARRRSAAPSLLFVRARGLSRHQTQLHTDWTQIYTNWVLHSTQSHSQQRSLTALRVSRRTPRSANESAAMPRRRKASSE